MITAVASRVAPCAAKAPTLSARRGSKFTAGAAPVAHLRAAPKTNVARLGGSSPTIVGNMFVLFLQRWEAELC